MPAPVLDDADAFAALVRLDGALIGLDLGTKTIGVAASDATRSLVTPVKTICRTKFTRDVETLECLMARRDVVGVVLGLPLNMDDSEGPRAQSTRAFAREAAKRWSIPILLWDERLSTEAAKERLQRAGAKTKESRDAVDRVAAAIILEEALAKIAARKL